MMDREAQLKLQAFVDGELPEAEARGVASRLAQDAEATALLQELRNTRQAFKQSEPDVKLPESREFYWSKIQREIERRAVDPEPRQSESVWRLWRRILVPTSVVALLAMVVLTGVQQGFWGAPGPDTEMTLADSGTFTYHDFANGTTLVWVSYPAER